MKTRHNKKRNTAFVYEALIREATVAILKHDAPRRAGVLKILKKHFGEDSLLKKDLEHHQALYENQALDAEISEKILREVKIASRLLDAEGGFKAQSELIYDINTELDAGVFNNFVPNYKSLASIAQIFSDKTSPKDRVLLEREIVAHMVKTDGDLAAPEEIDNFVIATFTEKFNNKYEINLLDEQKELLTHYISSFADNALQLKVFLNEEIGRLKLKLEEAKVTVEIKHDNTMLEKTNSIIERLNTFANASIDDGVLLTVMKTQSLVKEIFSDGNHH